MSVLNIFPKVNQVIYTLAQSSMPNMNILALTFFPGFCKRTLILVF